MENTAEAEHKASQCHVESWLRQAALSRLVRKNSKLPIKLYAFDDEYFQRAVCCSGKSFLHSDLKFIEFGIAPRSRRFHKNAYDFGIIENVSRYESETTSWSEYIFSLTIEIHDSWISMLQIHDSLIMFRSHSDIIVYDNRTDSVIRRVNLAEFSSISSAFNELPNSIIEINQFSTKLLQSGAIILSHALPP